MSSKYTGRQSARRRLYESRIACGRLALPAGGRAYMKEIKPAALKTAEASQYLNISESTLRALSDKGDIPCRRLNKQRYFSLKDLDRWMASLPSWSDASGQN